MQPDSIIQNYRLIRPLGEGGMGEVWLAEHTHLGRQVAIKCLHPQLLRNEGIRARFKQEATTLARLQHPGIVALHDYIEDDAAAYLVMEYVEGTPLDDYINQKSGPIPEAQLHELFKQVLDAFSYAHGRKVIHRDIKPGNFMITEDGRIKVLDFGIAKVLEQTDHKLTKTGTHMGTVLYMSPEQVKGGEVDHRSDIYSLGVLLFQMATGQCPYDSGTTEFVVYDQIVNHPLPTASGIYPGVSKRVEQMIAKATAKQPQDRFQDCDEFMKGTGIVDAPAPIREENFAAVNAPVAAPVQQSISSLPHANASRSAPVAPPGKFLDIKVFGIISAVLMGLLGLWFLGSGLFIMSLIDGDSFHDPWSGRLEYMGEEEKMIVGLITLALLFIGLIFILMGVSGIGIAARGKWGRVMGIVMMSFILLFGMVAGVAGLVLSQERDRDSRAAGGYLCIAAAIFTCYFIWGGITLFSGRAGRYFRREG